MKYHTILYITKLYNNTQQVYTGLNKQFNFVTAIHIVQRTCSNGIFYDSQLRFNRFLVFVLTFFVVQLYIPLFWYKGNSPQDAGHARSRFLVPHIYHHIFCMATSYFSSLFWYKGNSPQDASHHFYNRATHPKMLAMQEDF